MEEIKKISIKDADYPKALKKIKNAPPIIYYQGKIAPEELCFAIVGTRRCSSYGKQIALDFAKDLTNAGLTIVSGLAPGIDTFAHKSALEQKKRTIAVLGTSLDEKSFYPKENLELSRKIIEFGGCLISEYPPGTRGNRFTFPNRNRIISGLSLGVLVVEAKRRSGALITANYGLSQEKKVFAAPGSIYSKNSQGCHELIKKGAELVDNASDILKELNLLAPLDKLSKEQTGTGNVPPEEKLILDALKEESLHIDKIIERTKLSASVVAGMLTIMEIEKKVRSLGGNIYAIMR